MSRSLNLRIEHLSNSITELSKINYEKDQLIKELIEDKRALTFKYETSKQLNFDLYNQVDSYRNSLKNVQDDLDRKDKTIAIYVKNMNDNKLTIVKDKSNLEIEVNDLKDTLKSNHAQINRLRHELCSGQQGYQEMRQKLTEERDRIALDRQRLINCFEEENKKLLVTNKELNNTLANIRQIHTKDKQKMKSDLVKIHDYKLNQMKRTIASLKERCVDIKRRIDCNERETMAYKYRSGASRLVYQNAIKKLTKFGVENNEEVMTAIIQVIEKMRSNSQRRIMDKTTKTIIRIKNQKQTINKNFQNLIQGKVELKDLGSDQKVIADNSSDEA